MIEKRYGYDIEWTFHVLQELHAYPPGLSSLVTVADYKNKAFLAFSYLIFFSHTKYTQMN